MSAPEQPIKVTVFQAENSRQYLSAVFAAWSRGEIIAAPPSSVTAVPGLQLTAPQSFDADPGWFDETLIARPAGDLAQIAFSSGTTGQPKAIALTHGAQWDVVHRINDAMQTDASIREYVGVPITFSFGFGRVRAVAAAGGRSFLPANGFDPTEIARMLQAGDINAISAVPTLWRIVLANPDVIGAAGKSLKWIEIGSQFMSGAEKLALRQLFPNAKIVQHYGLTEASRSTLLDISEAPEDRLGSIGRATGNVEIALDQEGIIKVRGPHLASGLITQDGLTPIAGPDGWLSTSDMGRIEEGWLYYEGRVDDLINSGGVKIDPTRFEQRLATDLGRADAVAVARLTDKLRGEKVLVALRQDAGVDRLEVEAKAQRIAESYGLTGKGSLVVREVSAFPVTATGKIQRRLLPDLPDLSRKASGAVAQAPAATGKTAEIQALWAEVLGLDTMPLDKSFYDIGGDSLSALTVIMRMESMGLKPEVARSIFDGKTIREIAQADDPDAVGAAPIPQDKGPQATGLTLSQTINSVHALRGLLALWVVAVHWMPGVLERLGDRAMWFYEMIGPAMRFGTPGFAMVFGVGIGALGLVHYQENKARFLRGQRFNTRLVTGGVLVLAAIQGGVLWSEGQFGDRLTLSRMFFSVIAYYALALLTMPWLMKLLHLGQNRLINIFAVGLGAMIVHEILFALFAHTQPPGLIELIKILFTAKYGFFKMTGYAMIGAGIGYLVRQHHNDPAMVRNLFAYGLMAAGLGVLMLYRAAPDDVLRSFNLPEVWHMSIFAGAVMLFLASFSMINRSASVPSGLRYVNAFAIASGLLALPIYVGHEMVIPTKTLLTHLGLPGIVALAIPMGAFFAVMGVMYIRLLRILVH